MPRDKKYALDAAFPLGDDDTRNEVDCRPTCGVEQRNVDGFFSVAALPAGKCSGRGECQMGAYTPGVRYLDDVVEWYARRLLKLE